MFGWTTKQRPLDPDPRFAVPTYRVEVKRRTDGDGHDLHFYGGGEFSPYCIESLVDMLRSEAHGHAGDYEVTFELVGSCSAQCLEEVANRFSAAAIPGVRGVIRAAGHRDLALESTRARSLPTPRPSAPSRPS
jgi:hypothetical protein